MFESEYREWAARYREGVGSLKPSLMANISIAFGAKFQPRARRILVGPLNCK